MAKKMYYTEQEAAEALGVSAEELQNFVRDDKLRAFMDGGERMFKAEDVDALTGGGQGVEEEIELTPADTTADQVDLSEAADEVEPKSKEDTVITAEGISIFDDEDLEIEPADPMAKTQITTSLEDQVSVDGVGSGSGLLDLTRESDNTSLGAVLDNIDVEEGLESEIEEEPEEYTPAAPSGAAAPAAPVVVEAVDTSSGFFGGMIVGSALVALAIAAVVMAAVQGLVPAYLEFMKSQMLIVLGGSAALIVVFGIIGLLVGKSAAQRRQAMGRMGG